MELALILTTHTFLVYIFSKASAVVEKRACYYSCKKKKGPKMELALILTNQQTLVSYIKYRMKIDSSYLSL